jgi:hypothetical protein
MTAFARLNGVCSLGEWLERVGLLIPARNDVMSGRYWMSSQCSDGSVLNISDMCGHSVGSMKLGQVIVSS